MGLGMLFFIALPVLLVIGGAYLFSFLREQDRWTRGRQDTPRRILDMRLAKGEITLEEYKALRNQFD